MMPCRWRAGPPECQGPLAAVAKYVTGLSLEGTVTVTVSQSVTVAVSHGVIVTVAAAVVDPVTAWTGACNQPKAAANHLCQVPVACPTEQAHNHQELIASSDAGASCSSFPKRLEIWPRWPRGWP